MADNTRKYLNGAFLKQSYNRNDSLLINMWVPNLAEFVKEIQALTPDEKGGINLTIGTQKADKTKYSLWVDDRPRGGGGQVASSQQSGYRPAPKQNSSYANTQQGPPTGAASYGSGAGPTIDDLPF